MNIHKCFKSEHYFTHADIPDDELDVTIKACRMLKTEYPPKEEEPHLFFESHEKPLVLNKTNGQKLAMRYGDETDDWIGKEITLKVSTTTMDSVERPCVRVK